VHGAARALRPGAEHELIAFRAKKNGGKDSARTRSRRKDTYFVVLKLGCSPIFRKRKKQTLLESQLFTTVASEASKKKANRWTFQHFS
jgi:hypothetical protein